MTNEWVFVEQGDTSPKPKVITLFGTREETRQKIQKIDRYTQYYQYSADYYNQRLVYQR